MILQRKPELFEAFRFPTGGKSQHEVCKWVTNNGGRAELWDGVVETLDVPDGDGSRFRWRLMGLECDQVMLTVRPGDLVAKDEHGRFHRLRPESVERLFERIDEEEE